MIINNVIIIVPTLVLKQQWEERLAYYNLSSFCNVLVINTAYKNNYICDFLIIDEVHKIPSTEFRKCLETIKYNYSLHLTATLERLDGEEKFLLSKFSICDTITLKECLNNKWISEYAIYNLAVPFSYEEYIKYKKINNSFKYYAKKCTNNNFNSSFECATYWLSNGTTEEKKLATGFYRNMSLRKDLLINNSNKLPVTIEIIKRFQDRLGLVFSESIKFANTLHSKIPDICLPIHSKIGQKEQEIQLQLFKDRAIPQTYISSCKSLIAGLDIPQLSIGIIASASSSKIASIQSLGRLLRIQENKQAIFINLYTPDYEEVASQEVKWLLKRQQGMSNINWITDINEID